MSAINFLDGKLSCIEFEPIKHVSCFVIHDNPASIGVVCSLSSFPYKQYPISSLNESLHPNPTGNISSERDKISFQSFKIIEFGA